VPFTEGSMNHPMVPKTIVRQPPTVIAMRNPQ
jgi:hypothetical protein